MALEEELRTCIPTVFQRNSMTILLNAVRVRQNNNHSVLCLKPCILVYMLVYTSIYVQYECIYSYLGIEAMKTSLLHVERVTSGTHSPSEQLGLPLNTAKSCQFTCHNMVMQDATTIKVWYIMVYTSIYFYIIVYTHIYYYKQVYSAILLYILGYTSI